MKTGTKSVLYGVHQFAIHPLFVLLAWRQLYGFPWDPRVWACAVLHDLGYIGKAEMDSDDGERHVEWGAWAAGALFGRRWYEFCLGHSRHYARREGVPVSRLCYADKLAIVLCPAWLYLPLARLSGELSEYRLIADRAGFVPQCESDRSWKLWLDDRMVKVAMAGEPDAVPYCNASAQPDKRAALAALGEG